MGDAQHPPDAGRGAVTRPRVLPEILFGLAVAVGTLIRIDQIADQIPGDDEWHALHALLAHGYDWIFTHFGTSDHSIPLTLYDKLLADTVGLSEMGMRAPMLVAGIASLLVLPLLLRPTLGVKASLAFAWLLAISPLHVYYSRYARPYSLAFTLAILSAIAFDRWRRTARPRWAVAYVVFAVLGTWLHPIFLPFTLAPFAGLAVRKVLLRGHGGAEESASPGSFWPLALGAAAGLLALVGPPLVLDFDSLAARSGGSGARIAPPMKVFELLSGANQPLLAFGFGIALVLGVVAMRRRWAGLAGSLAFASAVQAAVVLLVGPAEIGVPITTARYLLPALVLVLLLAAVGLGHVDGLLRKEWKRFPPHVATAVLGVSLLAFGPLPAIHYRPNDFTNHTIFQYNYDPNFPHNFASRTLGLKSMPAFYLELAEQPASDERIVEAPWFYEWHRQPFALYQRVHRRGVLVGFVSRPGKPLPQGELPWPDRRFRFRNFVHVSDREHMREENVRYVVFHRNPPRPPPDGEHPSVADTLGWIEEYRQTVGAPVYEDDDLCVFDLRGAR